MYVQNGHRAGFWVQHRTWTSQCARVSSIAGQQAGKLPGDAPLYGNAEVLVQGFDVRSGRPIPLGPKLETPGDRNFVIIAEPSWYRGTTESAAAGKE
jgi:hypothetical protein